MGYYSRVVTRVPPSSLPPGPKPAKPTATPRRTSESKTQRRSKLHGSLKKTEAADEGDEGAVETARTDPASPKQRSGDGDSSKSGGHKKQGEPEEKKAEPPRKQPEMATWAKAPARPALALAARGPNPAMSAPHPPVRAAMTTPIAPVKTELIAPTALSRRASRIGMRLGTGTLRAEKPPDAYALLKDAKPAGVYFREDSMHEGRTASGDDGELGAAVAETIRLLAAAHAKGIARVSAGRNEADESVIVIVAAHAFSAASLAAVPEKVHRFRTVVAIPFELLPLRRER